jgi:hypothetical protein
MTELKQIKCIEEIAWIIVAHHFYDPTFCLDREKCLLYITWALHFDS